MITKKEKLKLLNLQNKLVSVRLLSYVFIEIPNEEIDVLSRPSSFK